MLLQERVSLSTFLLIVYLNTSPEVGGTPTPPDPGAGVEPLDEQESPLSDWKWQKEPQVREWEQYPPIQDMNWHQGQYGRRQCNEV